MKNWTMPKVVIDEFKANEYCGSCYDTFVSNESAVRAILGKQNQQVDFNGPATNPGGQYGNVPDGIAGSYTSSNNASQYAWDRTRKGPYDGWLYLKEGTTVAQAEQYKAQGLISDYFKYQGEIWGKFSVYWITSSSGTNHWHPNNGGSGVSVNMS